MRAVAVQEEGLEEDRDLPVEDEEVSKAAHKAFEKRGLKFRVGAKVTKLEKSKTGVSLTLEAAGKAETLQAEVALVAVGSPATISTFRQ